MLCNSEQIFAGCACILFCIGSGTIVPMNDWAKVLQHTKLRVNPHSFATWFRPTRMKGTDHRRLLVRVPTVLCKKKLTETYGELLQAVLQEVGMPDTQLEYICTELELPTAACTLNPAEAHEESKHAPQPEKKIGMIGTIETIQKRV